MSARPRPVVVKGTFPPRAVLDEATGAPEVQQLAVQPASVRRGGPTAQVLLSAAYARVARASVRDVAARARDEAAELRDHTLRESETLALAARDRLAAEVDRALAARDREQALTDLELLSVQLATAETDQLTGVQARDAGLHALDRALEQCSRDRLRLVVVYVDVDGLKALNDSDGHAAGDRLLARVAHALQRGVRPGELIVRLGGDEFLVVMPGSSLSDAQRQFAVIDRELAPGASITAGFAEHASTEPADLLVARADRAMLDARRGGRSRESRAAPS